MSLFQQSQLQKQELITGLKVKDALDAARNSSHLQRFHALRLLTADPRWLNASNPKARIRWGRLVCEELSQYFHLEGNQLEPGSPIFLVTLCDRRCCASDKFQNLDIPGFIRTLRKGLRGLSYFGMLEPAYYVNVCQGARIHGNRMVSWHVHLLAWGESRKRMKQRIEQLNRKILLPIADGLAPAHQNGLPRARLQPKSPTS
jgi:hypothetical protein